MYLMPINKFYLIQVLTMFIPGDNSCTRNILSFQAQVLVNTCIYIKQNDTKIKKVLSTHTKVLEDIGNDQKHV